MEAASGKRTTYHRRCKTNKLITSGTSHVIRHRSEPPLLMMEAAEEQQQQTQQIVSWCTGKKRMKRERKAQLPEDIIQTEILTKLPAISLVRFRLVCKSWKNLLSTPGFIKSHLTRLSSCSYEEEDLIIARKEVTDHPICIVSRYSNEIQVHAVPRIRDVFLGSINGLVCMSSKRGDEYCLWNPATGQLVEIHLPSHIKNCRRVLGGLTWDHLRNDYKVVVVCSDSSTHSIGKICVYSSNSASWTEVRILDRSTLPYGQKLFRLIMAAPSTIVKGIPYWWYSVLMMEPGMRRERQFIRVYKFVAEINEFRSLPLLGIHSTRFKLVNIKDRLVGMAFRKYLVDVYSLDEESRGGEWSKMYTLKPIILPGSKLPTCYASPVSDYDPKIKETAEMAKFLVTSRTSRKFFGYTPSLVCVQGMKSMLEFSKM